VEYGLVVFAIAAVVAVAVFALGPPVRGLFDTTCQTIHSQLDNPTQSCS
jgi:Flp pilus assembly pilin Flp